MNENIILIIGASSDIGLELIAGIEEEATIIAHYHTNIEGINSVSSETSNQVIPLKADLSSESQVIKLIDTIKNTYGVPNKIVHLAANAVENIRFKDIQWPNFQQEIEISLKSIVMVLNAFLPILAMQRKGKVVFMLSSYTLGVPPAALAHYNTTKYALLGLMKSLASEYSKKNIQINALSPSMIETKFLEKINPKLVEITAEGHPLKRNATVKDIVPMIKMLISEESNYMTGVNIPITGGSNF